MALPTISAGDLTGKGVTGMPPNPELSVADLQAKFDELSLDVIVPKIQTLVTALESASAGVDLGVTAPAGITASNKVKSVLDAISVILLAIKAKSDGDYDDLVTLLAGITAVSDVVDGLSTTIPTAKAITDFIQDIGGGDMLRTTYDTNLNGIVDNSEKLGGYSVDQLFLTANKTLYVSPTGSDTTGNGTSGSPYKTIAKALSIIPKNLNGFSATIVIASGTYTENILIIGFTSGTLGLSFSGATTLNGYIYGADCTDLILSASSVVPLTINNSLNANGAINTAKNSYLAISNLAVTVNGNSGTFGVYATEDSSIYNRTSFIINNCSTAIRSHALSNIFCDSISGTGNSVGLAVDRGDIKYGTNTISATTPITISGGGIISNDLVTKTEVLRHYVLWTNPSPTVSFSAQPITLSEAIENFSYYEIIYANNNLTSAAQLNSGKITSGKRTVLHLATTDAYYRSIVSISGTTIEFGDSTTVLYAGGSSTANTNLIPIKIIGYK